MEKAIIQFAFFLICFNISGLATTNILRLTSGNTLSVLTSKCYCDNCGTAISPFLQLPIISYVICKGRCRNCKTRIPVDALVLEITVLMGMFIILISSNFTVRSVTISFLYYEIIRVLVIVRNGKRENGFIKQYIIAVLSMTLYYAMMIFVSLLYGVVCNN